MTPARRLLLPLLALFLLAPAGASADVKQESASQPVPGGEVAAQLTYDKKSDFEYEDVRLKLTRNGATLLDALVPAPCRDCPVIPQGLGEPDIPSLKLTDLNKDGEPEVLVDLYTGGAHCCSYTQIYAFRADPASYRRVKASWGDYGYELQDLDRDGMPEFRSADWRFAGAFTAYAASGAPPRVFSFKTGRLTDVTRRYRSLVKSNLKQYLRLYKEWRGKREGDVRGFLAAYVADKYLLGQGDTAFDLVYAAHRRGELRALPGDTSPAGKRYIRSLRIFLRKTGYR